MANMSTSSGLDVPINLAVDFADDLDFELGLGSSSPHISVSSPSSVPMSPSPSQSSTAASQPSTAMSPTSTAYMTSPPTSPIPTSFLPDTRPDSDSEPERRPSTSKHPSSPLPQSYKGKSRAIPTPTPIHVLRDRDLPEFHTPPDTTFGTPSGSGPSTSRGKARAAPDPPRNLPSIMPLASSDSELEPEAGPEPEPEPEPSPEPGDTPRPSLLGPRSRVASGLSFSSIREAVQRRKSSSRLGSAASGTNSPVPGLGRKLSLKGLGALVKRKASRSRSGLNSQVTSGASTPASAFVTPASTIGRRGGHGRAAPSTPWNEMAHTPVDEIPSKLPELVRPIRARADTAPTDYFGFTFQFEDEQVVPVDDNDADDDTNEEPSQEDSSDVLIPSGFGSLPRELHLWVLVHLVGLFVEDYEQQVRQGSWTADQAASEHYKWVGEAAGLRAVVATSRVSRTWHAIAHDGSFWSKLTYASLVPPRVGIPPHTNWVPFGIRAQAKVQLSPAQLEAQDERVLRLVKAAGPCLTELDLRGFARVTAKQVERLVGWISAPAPVATKSDVPGAPSLLSLTRYDFTPVFPAKTTNLVRLVLSSCARISSSALHALLSASPHLTHLQLRALPSVKDETCSILSAYCRNLTHLDLDRCQNLGPEAIAHVCGVSRPYVHNTGLFKLKTLLMAGYAYVDSTSLRRLGKSLGGVLETLSFAGAWGISDEALAAYVEIQPTPTQIEQHKLLHVERWARKRGAAIEPAEFVALTAREAGLDPTLAGPFYRRVTALRHLNLGGCRRLTDAGLGSLAHGVPDLEVLEVSGIAGIGEPGLVRLFKTTPKIRRLDLEETAVGDAVLDALTPPMELDPQGDTETENEESIQISMRADTSHPGSALTHLVLSHCTSPSLTSTALAQLVRACPMLKVLSVDGTQVDDRVVRFFVCASQARSLVGAEIAATDTRHVARSGLPPLGSTRPRRGTRDWASRGMAYVDGGDGDECDAHKVVLKTYWSWQAVDAVLDRRRVALGRRNTDGMVGPSGVRVSGGGGGPRWRREDRAGCVIM